jgi:hypothetical protein
VRDNKEGPVYQAACLLKNNNLSIHRPKFILTRVTLLCNTKLSRDVMVCSRPAAAIGPCRAQSARRASDVAHTTLTRTLRLWSSVHTKML